MQIDLIKILLIEDNPGDARLIQEMLRSIPNIKFYHEINLHDSIRFLQTEIVDVILLDLGLPDSQNLETFFQVREQASYAPIVVLTGNRDEGIGEKAVQEGAQDFYIKGEVQDYTLRRAIKYAMERFEIHEKLDHLNHVLVAIRNVNQLIVHEKNPEQLIRKICDILVENRGYNAVWIALEDNSGSPLIPTHSGWGELFRPIEKMIEGGVWPRCHSMVMESPSDFVIINPTIQCDGCPLQSHYGGEYSVIIALKHENRCFGILGATVPFRIELNEHEKTLIREVAGDISFALYSVDLERRGRIVEERFQRLYRTMAQGVVFQDSDGKIIHANPAAESIMGLNLEQMQGRTSTDKRWKAIREDGSELPGEEHFAMIAMRTGQSSNGIMGIVNPQMNEYRWIKVHAVPEFDETMTRPIGVFSTFEDITELRTMFQQIEESKRMLDATGEMARIGAWKHDFRTGKATWSKTLHDIIGIPHDQEPPGVEEHYNYYPDEDREKLRIAYINTRRTGEPFNLDLHVYTSQKESIWCRVQGDAVFEKGKCVMMWGSFQDITEKKISELKLAESEEKYRLLMEETLDVIWKIDLDMNFTYVNPSIKQMFGYEPDEWIGTNYKEHCDAEHYEDFRKRLENELLRGPKSLGIMFETMMLDRWMNPVVVEIHAKMIYNEKGESIFCQGSTRDISYRKLAELALKENEQRYRSLVMQSSDCLLFYDLSGNIIDVNDRSCKTYGYSREELLSMNISDLDPEYTQRVDNGKFYDDIDIGVAKVFNAWQKKKDGQIIPVEIRISQIQLGDDTYIQGLCRDISDKVEAEKKLQERERLLRFAIEQMPVPVIIASAPDGEIMYYNEPVLDLTVKRPSDINSKYLEDPQLKWPTFYPDGTPYEIDELPMIQAIKQGKKVTNRETIIRTDKCDYWISVNAAPLFDDDGKIIAGIVVFPDITELKCSQDALRESEEKLRAMVQNVGMGVVMISRDMRIIEMNRQMSEWYPDIKLSDKPICYRHFRNPPIDRECDGCPTKQALETGRAGETVIEVTFGSSVRKFRIVASPIRDSNGDVVAAIEMVEDITERLSLEEQLRQSQKLEAIGQLAGGVAHDFNNMLGVIIGYAELMLDSIHENDPLYELVNEIIQAGKRSAALTRQLLAFSRKQTLQVQITDLNDLVKNLNKMLRRLIGEDIDYETHLVEDLPLIEVDPGQIEQVIINLAVNARDAMPRGGKLTIETRSFHVDDQYVNSHYHIEKGHYVMLTITDNGIGMDEETREKIFEPFFTTKGQGKGTGLGLSTVYGIIRQSGGIIMVYSEEGVGTTFKILLPISRSEIEEQKPENASGQPILLSSIKILIVEDDDSLRNLIYRAFRKLKCDVRTSSNGGAALLEVEEKGFEPDIILTDVVMPEMSGKILINRLRKNMPDLKVVYMSGYTDNAIVHHGMLDPNTPFIQKPFNMKDLISKIEETLRG